MNPDTEQLLKQMGFFPFDAKPDPEDGKITWFIPDAGKRPRFSIQLFEKASPSAVMHAIWNAGAEEKRKEIAKRHADFVAALA